MKNQSVVLNATFDESEMQVYQTPHRPGKRSYLTHLLEVKTWSDERVIISPVAGTKSFFNGQTRMAFRLIDVARLVDLLSVPRGFYHHRLKWYHDPFEAQRWLRAAYRRKLLKCYTSPPYFWNSHTEQLFYDELYRKETFELNQRGIFITKTLIQHERSLRENPSHTK